MQNAGKRCAFYTLGCKVNQYDTEGLIDLFRERGYDIVDFNSEADVYCINTCTVTQTADKKSRQAARRGRRQNPDAIVAVIGCYAQVAPDEVASIDGVDVVIGTEDRASILDLVEQAMKRKSGSPLVAVRSGRPESGFEDIPISCPTKRVRGFVKIQEGCDEFCAYCRVPLARGPSRSRELKSILAEVSRLVNSGIREIVLTGIHIGMYGRDLRSTNGGEILDLPGLIEEIHRIPKVGRIRLSSVEPLDIDEHLIEKVGRLPKVAKHFHIPLQSGDDEILRSMGRRYTTADYMRLVESIRSTVPGVAITTDIMVGFPGETEENFSGSYQFADSLRFSRMHVFKFSRRPGTCAFYMKDQVDSRTKQLRSEKMIELAEAMEREFCQSLVGEYEELLAEDYVSGRGVVAGLGSRYVHIEAPGGENLVSTLVPVRIVSAVNRAVMGERVLSGEEGFES